MRKKIAEEAANNVLRTIQNDMKSGELDGGAVWHYITDNTNIIELSQKKDHDPTTTVALSAFFAGIKWCLECIRFDEDDLVDDDEDE